MRAARKPFGCAEGMIPRTRTVSCPERRAAHPQPCFRPRKMEKYLPRQAPSGGLLRRLTRLGPPQWRAMRMRRCASLRFRALPPFALPRHASAPFARSTARGARPANRRFRATPTDIRTMRQRPSRTAQLAALVPQAGASAPHRRTFAPCVSAPPIAVGGALISPSARDCGALTPCPRRRACTCTPPRRRSARRGDGRRRRTTSRTAWR